MVTQKNLKGYIQTVALCYMLAALMQQANDDVEDISFGESEVLECEIESTPTPCQSVGVQERPVETGFYYLNSRYYDPEIGRFISPDG